MSQRSLRETRRLKDCERHRLWGRENKPMFFDNFSVKITRTSRRKQKHGRKENDLVRSSPGSRSDKNHLDCGDRSHVSYWPYFSHQQPLSLWLWGFVWVSFFQNGVEVIFVSSPSQLVFCTEVRECQFVKWSQPLLGISWPQLTLV